MGTMREGEGEGEGEAGVLRSREDTYYPHSHSHFHIPFHTPTSLLTLPHPFSTSPIPFTLPHLSLHSYIPPSYSHIPPHTPPFLLKIPHPASDSYIPPPLLTLPEALSLPLPPHLAILACSSRALLQNLARSSFMGTLTRNKVDSRMASCWSSPSAPPLFTILPTSSRQWSSNSSRTASMSSWQRVS